jgi:hypothetical protein
VKNAADYDQVATELDALTAKTQVDEKVDKQKTLFWTREYPNARCSQVIVRLRDDRGQNLSDYELFLTAGPNYSPDELPEGFFVDRQRNRRNPGKLTYYLNWDVLDDGVKGLRKPELKGKFGFRIVARPLMQDPAVPNRDIAPGLAGYRVLHFKSDLDTLSKALRPNETLMLDIELKRLVDIAVFRITNDLTPRKFDRTPDGRLAK